MKVLVTGAAGMIGSCLVRGLLDAGYDVVALDRRAGTENRATNVVVDLADADAILKAVEENQVDRVIHLAALAHTDGEQDLSFERYYHVNVECAKNVFKAAKDRPVLFISTVDVYGFTKGVVSAESELHPVTHYGKTKALAEAECKKLCEHYTIFRLSPVYTPEVKRDIQKRYYLKAPDWAYLIGKGSEYEVLDIAEGVRRMVEWCGLPPDNAVHIIKDEKRLYTPDCIVAEQEQGRATHVLHFPRWLITFGAAAVTCLTGRNKYTYLLNKAVKPLRTE